MERLTTRSRRLQAHQEVGHEVVGLAVLQVGDREAKPCVLGEADHALVAFEKVRGLLLPAPSVGHDEVQMAGGNACHWVLDAIGRRPASSRSAHASRAGAASHWSRSAALSGAQTGSARTIKSRSAFVQAADVAAARK